MLTLITQSNLTLSWFEPLSRCRTFAFFDSSPACVVELLGSKLRGLGQHLCMRRSTLIKANRSLHTLLHTRKIPLIYMGFLINFFIIIHRSAVRIREAPPKYPTKSDVYGNSQGFAHSPHALTRCGFFVMGQRWFFRTLGQ
jgi:hypothetical protein